MTYIFICVWGGVTFIKTWRELAQINKGIIGESVEICN